MIQDEIIIKSLIKFHVYLVYDTIKFIRYMLHLQSWSFNLADKIALCNIFKYISKFRKNPNPTIKL